MAARRPPSVCVFCRARQVSARKRSPWTIAKRRLETVAVRPEDDGVIFPDSKLQKERDGEGDGPVLGLETSLRQWKLPVPVNEQTKAALEFDALWQQRDVRLEVLRSLSNPWPKVPAGHQHHVSRVPYLLPEANAAVVPHATFRENVKRALGQKAVRQVLRAQLLRCQTPKDILRIMAVAFQNPTIAEHLATMEEPMMRALYRCRGAASDPEVLKTLNIIITRFRYADFNVHPQLLFMALKFAARARSLPVMKKYLKLIRQAGLVVSSNVFRSVIAKFSIGHRGLGEIRNGRWKRRELLEVLTGFEDEKHLPEDQQNHFGTLLIRHDWGYLHGWIAALARCKDSDSVWKEWELWKESDARKVPKSLVFSEAVGQFWRTRSRITSKKRGDYWFLEQMTLSGDSQRAWEIFKETGIPFEMLKTTTKDRLLDHPEHATIWDKDMGEQMLQRYDRHLSKIESVLGVQWVPDGEDGDGSHQQIRDKEEALETLAEDGWKLEDDFGFPHDTEPIVPQGERALHDATESTPAID